MTELPDPLVPAEVDLRGFETMPLAVQMLRDSRFAAEVSPEAFRAGVLLWCAAWHQVPAGSLPDNDAELAKLAGYGFVVKEWRKVKSQAMTKFIRCSDGRWYHEELSDRAVTAWRARLEHFYERARERLRKANKARADKSMPPLAELTFDQWNDRRLSGGVPMEKADAFRELPPEVPPETPPTFRKLPPENALKGEGEGTERERKGEGEGKLLGNTEDLRSSVDDPPAAVDRPALALVAPSPGLPECPHQELIALYRKHLPHLRQPARWDGDRAESMRVRWRECAEPTSFGDGYRTKADGLAFWDRFFAFVAATPKLRDGITSREAGQVRVWKPDLPWLITRGNFLKVIEGAYE